MSDLPTPKIERLKQQVAILEGMIETRTRDLFLVNRELQQAAAFLEGVYSAMPSALFVLDAEGTIQTVNLAARTLLGHSEDALKGLHFDGVLTEGGAALVSNLLASEPDTRIIRREAGLRAADGSVVTVLLSAQSTSTQPGTASGQTPSIVIVATDIRAQKEMELELRQAQKLEAVGRLAAGIAHEINTPIQYVSDSLHFVREAFADVDSLLATLLTPAEGAIAIPLERIESQAESIDLDYLRENVPKALERAVDGLGRVATIVRAMKEFGHPDGRNMALSDINAAVLSTLTIAKNEYKYVADVHTELGELPPVPCHLGEINQTLLNLIVNGAHAIGERVEGTSVRGRITIRTYLEGDWACIAISDTGGGIPDSIRSRIFDPFFTTKELGKGTGQGLAIASAVVTKKHGGTLTFDSRLGEGTTFLIRLPIKETS